MSGRRRVRSPDLALVCGLSLLGLLVSLVAPGNWLQAVVLAPLVLAAPGYALTAALFPPGALEREDRVVYSFVLSVSAAALGGLVLQVVLNLDRGAWLALLLAITLAACAVAQRRRVSLPIQHADAALPRPPAGAIWAISFAAALAVAAIAVGVAVDGVREQQGRQRFTSFWALPVTTADGATRIEAGLWRHGGPASYRLLVSQGQRPLQSLRLRLGSRERWRTLLDPAVSAQPSPVLLTLYHRSAPYRSVELDLGTSP